MPVDLEAPPEDDDGQQVSGDPDHAHGQAADTLQPERHDVKNAHVLCEELVAPVAGVDVIAAIPSGNHRPENFLEHPRQRLVA